LENAMTRGEWMDRLKEMLMKETLMKGTR